MPALRLHSGQAPAGIQCSLSLGNPLRTLLRQRANYAQASNNLSLPKGPFSRFLTPGKGPRCVWLALCLSPSVFSVLTAERSSTASLRGFVPLVAVRWL